MVGYVMIKLWRDIEMNKTDIFMCITYPIFIILAIIFDMKIPISIATIGSIFLFWSTLILLSREENRNE